MKRLMTIGILLLGAACQREPVYTVNDEDELKERTDKIDQLTEDLEKANTELKLNGILEQERQAMIKQFKVADDGLCLTFAKEAKVTLKTNCAEDAKRAGEWTVEVLKGSQFVLRLRISFFNDDGSTTERVMFTTYTRNDANLQLPKALTEALTNPQYSEQSFEMQTFVLGEEPTELKGEATK